MGNKRQTPHLLKVLLVLFCVSGNAQANTGVPMLYVIWPPLILMLCPIILIETSYLSWALKVSFKQLWKRVTFANIISSLIGIPLVWFLWVCCLGFANGHGAYGHLETLTEKLVAGVIQAPWLIPYESEFYWLIPLAVIVLFCVFIITSWIIEGYFICKKTQGIELDSLLPISIAKSKISFHLLIAQVFSYIFVGIFLLMMYWGKSISFVHHITEKLGAVLVSPIIKFVFWIFS